MQRLLLIGLILLILIPITIAQDTECVTATGEPIMIGAIFPQDVLLVRDTSAYYRGADAMRQAINACGGVDSRPIEWIFETASSYDSAQAAFEHLTDNASVPLI